MSPRRSNKLSKASKTSAKKSPQPSEEVIQRRLRARRLRTWLKQVEPDVNIGGVVEEDRDIVSTCNGIYNTDKCRGEVVEITDNGLDESDEDGGSDCSIASGPSSFHQTTTRTSWILCSACQKLYEKAKRTKAPMKNKLQDNDPQSLTCDQWVLIKKWMPRKLPSPKRKRLRHVQLSKNRKNCVGMEATSTCLRPHAFLQRNLRRCITVPAKKKRKNVSKRTRKESQHPPVAKQQRLQTNKVISISDLDDSPNSSFSSLKCSNQIKNRASSAKTADVIPSLVTLETTKQKDVRAKQEAPKKMGGFRELLAQLRGNMIVREKR